MSNKVSVDAELSPGLYRIFNPEINSTEIHSLRGYVAKSGYEVGTPVTLALSQPSDLNELWVVRRIEGSPPNHYTLENIGQSQATFATDFDKDAKNFVFTTSNQHPYYIESPRNDRSYLIYTGPERAKAWTAGPPDGPIGIEAAGDSGQNWQFVSVLSE